jgi:hypothetical protein
MKIALENHRREGNSRTGKRRPPTLARPLTLSVPETKNSTKMKSENGDTCIDVDHVTLEANNYKNKYTNASVQTSPLIPYRLRFWPRSTCDVKCDPNENGCCTKIRLTCCCRILSQWVLSQVGLTVVVLSWALLGAFAFYKTEGEFRRFKDV